MGTENVTRTQGFARKLASPPDQVEGRLWAASTPSLRDFFSAAERRHICSPVRKRGVCGIFLRARVPEGRQKKAPENPGDEYDLRHVNFLCFIDVR